MKITFVCTGNTCRSPMAEALLKKYIAERHLDAESFSAGIYAMPGAALSAGSSRALSSLFGITDFSHSATPMTRALFDSSDLIFGMTQSHCALLQQLYGASEKLFPFPCEVGDPFGGNDAVYRACAEKIDAGIQEILDRWFPA